MRLRGSGGGASYSEGTFECGHAETSVVAGASITARPASVSLSQDVLVYSVQAARGWVFVPARQRSVSLPVSSEMSTLVSMTSVSPHLDLVTRLTVASWWDWGPLMGERGS